MSLFGDSSLNDLLGFALGRVTEMKVGFVVDWPFDPARLRHLLKEGQFLDLTGPMSQSIYGFEVRPGSVTAWSAQVTNVTTGGLPNLPGTLRRFTLVRTSNGRTEVRAGWNS